MTVLKPKKYMLVRMKKIILVFIQYIKCHEIVSQISEKREESDWHNIGVLCLLFNDEYCSKQTYLLM